MAYTPTGRPRGRPRSTSAAPSPSPRKTKDKKTATTAQDVLLFYPNLIGYLRIACMVGSFWYANSNSRLFLVLYLLAFGGDVVDGWFARRFNQSSTFGGVLDMVTDRVSTCGLLYYVGTRVGRGDLLRLPLASWLRLDFVWIGLIALDIFSHWFHVASVSGHHKSSESLKHRNALLQWYYSIYPLFGFACVGTELFYVFLYCASWPGLLASHGLGPVSGAAASGSAGTVLFWVLGAACALKQAVNVVQLLSAAHALAVGDADQRSGK